MRSLILFVTAACDSRCRHCFYSEAIKNAPSRTKITSGDARRLALGLGRIRDLSLSGGEPVLRADLEALLEPILRIGRPRSVTLPTGGLHPEKIEAAARMILRHAPRTRLTVALSMDGPQETHDHIRGVRGAYGKLRATHDVLAEAAGRGVFDLKLVTTICNLNADVLPETLDRARTDFPAAVFHHLEILRGKPPDPKVKPPDPKALDRFRPEIMRHWEGYRRFHGRGLGNRLARAAKARLFDLSVDYLRGADNMPPCRVYDTHLVVYETGEAAFCELTAPIGNVRREDLQTILNGPEAKRRKAMIRNGCTCSHSCFTPSNLLRSPREVLRVARNALRA